MIKKLVNFGNYFDPLHIQFDTKVHKSLRQFTVAVACIRGNHFAVEALLYKRLIILSVLATLVLVVTVLLLVLVEL